MIEDSFPDNSIERSRTSKDLFDELVLCEPKEVTLSVSSDSEEQKERFLNGVVRNPEHSYDALMVKDFSQTANRVRLIGGELVDSIDNPKYKDAYKSYCESYIKRMKLLEAAQQIHANPDDLQAKEDFMRINIEQNGEPDKHVFNSMLTDKLRKINAKTLTPEAEKIKAELYERLGDFEETDQKRFKPSAETVAWFHEVVTSLYEKMLSHVPDKENFSDEEIKNIFEEIIKHEFEEAGEGWEVIIEKGIAIKVKPSEKKISIPAGRQLDRETLCKRIVHELGIHMLRSVSGAQSDFLLAQVGMNGYYDTEEGTSSVTEQGLTGEYKEAGVEPYVTAGIAYHLNKDFRDTFEIKWRLSLLGLYKSGSEVSEASIDKARNTAYTSTLRSFRLTDELPWFKDLSYSKANVVWEFIESIRGDELQLSLMFLGKTNPLDRKQRNLMLETRTD